MLRRRIVSCAGLAAVLAVSLGGPRPAPAQAGRRPTLLVLVVVDQMRADYLTRFASHWTGGLKRLLYRGAVYDEARYPYLNTVTCAGHATLGTGAWPRTHGVILNQWYRRDEGKVRPCTADDSVRSVPYGGTPERVGHSAAQLRVPTLAERLRVRWPASRAVTLSVKARSAIMMAGKGATAVTWLGEDLGWQTSTAFSEQPQPAVAAQFARRAPEIDRAAVWERFGPLARYAGVDAGIGERPPKGWTALFPHPIAGVGPEGSVHDRWERSPYSDAALGAVASDLIDDFALGRRGDTVDFLGVSFSATDLVGHAFGPDSHEVADVQWRLDGTLNRLLQALDAKVGPGRYALALSADHGVAPIPEARIAAGLPAGRVPIGAVRTAIEAALVRALGPGPHVEHAEYTEFYLTPAAKARMTPEAIAAALAAARQIPGIEDAVWTAALDRAGASVIAEAMRAGFDAQRSGDITVAPAPYWFLVPGMRPDGGDGTTHGSSNEYDQHVPLILYGAGFKQGHSSTAATPADVAPSLAATVGLSFTGVEGRVLPPPR